ncbi:MAG: hypothetical protein NTW21_07700 [Verrucomicrobia bacterium]|nr:hypothetical protein [Verrucomicrobiota bacterium]
MTDEKYVGNVYEKGDHGMGLGGSPADPAKCHDWTRDCASWLKVEGFGRK